VDAILGLLKRATYYSILAPLSAALRQAVLRVKDTEIDHSQAPEVASLRLLASLAAEARQVLPRLPQGAKEAFEQLAQSPEGRKILAKFDQIIERYGYLSEVGTDIAVPTWKEDPQSAREVFIQFLVTAEIGNIHAKPPQRSKGKKGAVQRRVDLKGQVTEIYSQLLAHLRWCFVALEQVWLESGLLVQAGDIFFLEFDEVRRVVAGSDEVLINDLRQLVERRRSQLLQDSQLDPVPSLVYGNAPLFPSLLLLPSPQIRYYKELGQALDKLQGG
jgi:pyruvate,water dikinase